MPRVVVLSPSRAASVVPVLLIAVAGSTRALAVPPLPFPPVMELSALNGSDGFVINGIAASDYSGRAASFAGDVNGDGFADILIGAVNADPNGMDYAGEAYVVFGGQAVGLSSSIELSSLNGTNGFVIRGIDAGDSCGNAVSSVGDINGDGIDDFLVAAVLSDPGGNAAAGETYIVFGGPTVGASGLVDPAALNGTDGFTLLGIDAIDLSGWWVSGAGDVNGDGVQDLLIGAYAADPNGQTIAGETYVVFGGPGVGASGSISLSALNGVNGYVINGIDAVDRSGWRVSGAGDINADGIDDMIIGAKDADPNGQSGAGESYVVLGGPAVGASGSVELSSLNGANGFVANGVDAGDASGISVASAGDVNGDGVSDIVIGARFGDPNGQIDAGEAYVVFGKDTGIAGLFPASIELSALNGVDGFVVNGINPADAVATSVKGAGDVNSDGVDDILISGFRVGPGGRNLAGQTYVLFGRNTAVVGPFSAAFDLSSLNGANGFVLNGIDAGDISGYALSGGHDVNGDGVADFIIGASGADPNGQQDAGETYIVFGRAPVVCVGDITGDGCCNAADFVVLAGNFGGTVPLGTGGDLNGDGLVNAADFVILAGDFGCGAP